LQNIVGTEVSVIRFGGLIGYDRNPARFLSGKKDLKDGSVPVNLIHRDDCIAIIVAIIKQQKWGKVYNACSDEHPSRKDFYTKACILSSLPEPIFSEQEPSNQYKIIDSSLMKNDLQFSFKYKSPLDCLHLQNE
jgi:nucleoside-diphosphate-sugar epimerase